MRRPSDADQRTTWLAYAAFGWVLVFALMSFYWALGGTAGIDTLGEGFAPDELAQIPGMIEFVWITGVLKLVAGVAALSLVQRWGRFFPWRLRLFGVWAAGILFVLYALGNGVQHALMLTGGMQVASMLGSLDAVRWHLFFWDPFWLLGGVLFIAAAWRAGRARDVAVNRAAP